jgi:UDP:flavonoid glycosyltransferase YjiC (YdhE family)
MTKKKILFMAEGITMTHFVRAAALAATLLPEEWDLYFWTPVRYHRLLRQEFCRLGDLRTLSPQLFLESLTRGDVVYTEEVIRAYVREDQAIIREIRPDLIIGDYRLSLCISAPLCETPYASIFNAQWSPYYTQPAIVPEHPMTRWFSPRLLNHIFSVLRPMFNSWHAKPINDVRRSFGLPPIPHDLKGLYTAGDLTLYPDVPEFVPLQNAPSHHHFVGICPWSSATPKPAWWSEVITSSVPKIFVSLGSSGPVKALPAVLAAASSLPVEVVLSTSGRPVSSIPKNVHVAELLPYEETARHSAVVVSHGGTGGVYPALAGGTPMLAIPSNVDMHQSTYLLERGGAGIGIRVEDASPRLLQAALERLLGESTFREAAQKWAGIIAQYDTRKLFPELLKKWFAYA